MRLQILKYILIFVVGCIVGGYFINTTKSTKNKTEEEVIITHSLIVDKIEKLGNLEVIKYNMQDIIEYKKMRQWLPNAKTALLVRGEITACIDLTKIKTSNISISRDSIALLLPSPQICHVKIDHSQSKIYDTSYGLWESAQLVDEAYKYAEKELINQAKQLDLTKEARDNTMTILYPILTTLGFKHINIMYDDKLNKN